MPRRRKPNVLPLLLIAAVLFGLWLAFQIIVSQFGLLIGAAIIIAALLYGAAVAYQQAEARRIWAKVKDVSTLSGAAFEQHVAETYRRLGYQVKLTKKGADAGADVIADNGVDLIAIQCKQWSATVGNDAVQQVHTGKAVYACNRAAVVCTTNFTGPAKAAARATGVELVDGAAYAKLMDQAEGKPSITSPLLPGGRALIREIGWVGIGVIILGIHFLAPSFIQSEQYQVPDQPLTQATVFYPWAPTQPRPPTTQPTVHQTTRPKATPTLNRPPWWTPIPAPTRSAPGVSPTAVVEQPTAIATTSPISSEAPETTASPMRTSSPTATDASPTAEPQ